MAQPHYQRNLTALEALLYSLKTLEQKSVAPQVGFWIVGSQAKKHVKRLPQTVGVFYGVLEGVVIAAPHGRLHPVEHILSRLLKFGIEVLNALELNHGVNCGALRAGTPYGGLQEDSGRRFGQAWM